MYVLYRADMVVVCVCLKKATVYATLNRTIMACDLFW